MIVKEPPKNKKVYFFTAINSLHVVALISFSTTIRGLSSMLKTMLFIFK